MTIFWPKIDFFQKPDVVRQNGFKAETRRLSRSKPGGNQPMKAWSSLKKLHFGEKKSFLVRFWGGGTPPPSGISLLPHMLLSLSFQPNPSLNRVEPLHNFYRWKADMLLKVLVVNCEAVSCAAVLFMQWAIRFQFEPLRVSTHQATWFVSFNSQYWWQRRCLTQMWLRKEISSRKLVATIGKKCHGRQTQRKKEISVFFVDSSYFPSTPERVEELSRSFMMVPLMVNLLV